MLSHSQAKTLVDKIPGITPSGSLLTRAVAWIETSYGAGWGPHTQGAGVGSHNMGAITGAYNGNYFVSRDSRYDEASKKVIPYETHFRAYSSDEEGFTDLYRFLATRCPKGVEAAAQGDWPLVSRRMREARYYLGVEPYEASIATHQKRIRDALKAIGAKTGEISADAVDRAYANAPGPSPSPSNPDPKADGPGTTGPSPSAHSDTCFEGFPLIRAGDEGKCVALWQYLLNVDVTGTFDSVSVTATRIWQAANNLKPDGLVGPLSWSTMLIKSFGTTRD